MLEPYALKGARTVLRGLGDGDIPRLPDLAVKTFIVKYDGLTNVSILIHLMLHKRANLIR